MKSMKLTAMILCVALVEVPFAIHANAGMIPTGTAVSVLQLSHDRAKVASYMERSEVRAELTKFGVNPNEAAVRVAAMNDAEIQKIAGEIDRTPAGADAIVISLGTVLVVLIILLLLGKI